MQRSVTVPPDTYGGWNGVKKGTLMQEKHDKHGELWKVVAQISYDARRVVVEDRVNNDILGSPDFLSQVRPMSRCNRYLSGMSGTLYWYLAEQ